MIDDAVKSKLVTRYVEAIRAVLSTGERRYIETSDLPDDTCNGDLESCFNQAKKITASYGLVASRRFSGWAPDGPYVETRAAYLAEIERRAAPGKLLAQQRKERKSARIRAAGRKAAREQAERDKMAAATAAAEQRLREADPVAPILDYARIFALRPDDPDDEKELDVSGILDALRERRRWA